MNMELTHLFCFQKIKLYLAGFVSIFVHLLLFYQVKGPLSQSSFQKLLGRSGGLKTATEVSFFPHLAKPAQGTLTPRSKSLELPTRREGGEKALSGTENKNAAGGIPSRGIGQGGTSVQYASILHAYLDSAKVFPRSLKDLGLSGVVKVRFQVTPEGKLAEIHLMESEAPKLLQNEAIKFLQKLERVPIPPTHLTSQQLQFELPLRYELRS